LLIGAFSFHESDHLVQLFIAAGKLLSGSFSGEHAACGNIKIN
jgi:hypothetical protein